MTDAEMSEDEAQRETARTLADIMILLEFVGRQADSRLQAQFEDTRAGLSGLVPRLAVPPCPTYTRFLERLISIGSGPKRVCKTTGLQTAGRGALSTPSATAQLTSPPTDAGRSSDRPSSSDKPLSDRAFLYFSRDFLAAVAAPATVASIKFTAEYRKARGRSWLRCGRRWPRASRAPATPRTAPSLDNPAQPAEGASEERGSPLHDGAARLACQVASTKFLALLLTIFTLLVSTYAFSGHTILDSQHQTIVEYRAISALEEGYGNTNLDPPSWCDPANHYLRKDEQETRSASMAADQGPALSNATKCGLYWRLKSATENITAVNLHLMSWTRTVSMLQRPLPELFGMSPSFLDGSIRVHPELCERLHYEPVNCRMHLQHLIYRTPEIATAILGAIALYLLPALYGCLGATAATLRNLRRKVDLSLATGTDRGRMQQDVILGLLCGAVIGLFVGYLGKTTPETGLGTSALALLAGYNVPGVFAFLDELSNRVFRSGPTGAAHP